MFGYQCFGGTYCLHIRGKRKLLQENKVSKTSTVHDGFKNYINWFVSSFTLYLQDQDDLPFKKGEVLTVLSKDEEQWWTARNSLGQTGSIPVPYIQKVAEL
jgi:hypothetical protein